MLPRVKLFFETGAIGSTAPSQDGTAGLIASGVAVGTTFALGVAYLITKLSDLSALGITDSETDVNANIYKSVKEFYSEAPEGTKLWIMAFADTVTMADLFDVTKNYAKTLIEAANGEIKFLFVSKKDAVGYSATILDGLDADVYAALSKAQELGEWSADNKYAPVFSILEGRHYTGVPANLRNLHLGDDNRAAILIGDTVTGSKAATTGLLAGRIAAIPVQRSVARVKSGAIANDNLFIGSQKAENGNPELIHDFGFIVPRTFIGKTGYFWSDDKLATAVSDDYALIPRRRTIDKAYRIAYVTAIEELNDEIPVTDEGTIPAPIVKSLQNTIERAIEDTMGLEGNLGVDPGNPNDTGVSCFIDPNQKVVTTSKFEIKLRVKPFGYAKYIDVYLGFKVVNS